MLPQDSGYTIQKKSAEWKRRKQCWWKPYERRCRARTEEATNVRIEIRDFTKTQKIWQKIYINQRQKEKGLILIERIKHPSLCQIQQFILFKAWQPQKTTNHNTGSSQVTNISTNLNKLTTTQYIKIESEEEHSVEKNVPMYDFNKSHTVRIHPVNQETNTGLKQCDWGADKRFLSVVVINSSSRWQCRTDMSRESAEQYNPQTWEPEFNGQ